MISSGVRVWLARQRDRGQALPRSERLWGGLVWGSGLALVRSFGGSLLGPVPGVDFLVALNLALLGALGARDGDRLRKIMAGLGARGTAVSVGPVAGPQRERRGPAAAAVRATMAAIMLLLEP